MAASAAVITALLCAVLAPTTGMGQPQPQPQGLCSKAVLSSPELALPTCSRLCGMFLGQCDRCMDNQECVTQVVGRFTACRRRCAELHPMCPRACAVGLAPCGVGCAAKHACFLGCAAGTVEACAALCPDDPILACMVGCAAGDAVQVQDCRDGCTVSGARDCLAVCSFQLIICQQRC